MRPLDPNELERARAAFDAVFDPDWIAKPFRPALPARMLLYPLDYTMLEPEQYGAVAAAAEAVSAEQIAFLAPLGRPGDGWDGTYDRSAVELRDYASYKPVDTLVLEHAFYSPSGAWGLMTSDVEHAVAAGPPEFVATLRRHLPADDREMARTFIRHMRETGEGGGDTRWLDPLIEHVYGAEAAALLGRTPT